MTILIINISKESLHYYEFVKPIEKILEKNKIPYTTKDYDKLSKSDLTNASKIIISGTSIKDNEFLEDLPLFVEILQLPKPILGICGGLEIIGALLGGSIKERKEIGLSEVQFEKSFLNVEKEEYKKVYHLHNLYLDFTEAPEIEVYAKTYNVVPQAIKHKSKPIYATLFHPEVRNSDMILEFCRD